MKHLSLLQVCKCRFKRATWLDEKKPVALLLRHSDQVFECSTRSSEEVMLYGGHQARWQNWEKKMTVGFVIPVWPSGRPHRTSGLSLEGISWHLTFWVFFSKICRENLRFITICQELKVLYTKTCVHSCQQKSIGLKFCKSQTGSDVRYSCHHNSSRFTFPIFAHSCRFSALHSLQSITPRIY